MIFKKINAFLKPYGKKLKNKLPSYPNAKFFVFLIIFFYIFLIFFFFFKDIKKTPTYDQVRTNDYKSISWEEKTDNEGYSKYESAESCFEWKAVIIPPNKSYLFKVLDISQIHLHIKNLKGSVEIPSYVKIKEEKIKHSSTENSIIIQAKDVKEFTLILHTHFASFLGLNYISPLQGHIIDLNGKSLEANATIQVPVNSKIIKVGDGNYPAGVYKIDDYSYFFHNFSNPAVVYYQENYHLILQIILLINSIFFIIATTLVTKKYFLPIIRITNKKFFILFLFLISNIFFFSGLFPNPNSTVLNWDNRTNINYSYDKGYIVSDSNISNYLWYVLSITHSIDAMIIGNANDYNCNKSRFRHLYLTKFSVQKFIIIEGYENNSCAQIIRNLAPKKTVIVPQEKVEDELNALKKRNYFFKFLFPVNAKLIILLSNSLLFLSTAFLIWKAFKIHNIKKFLLFIIYSIVAFLGLIIIFTISGISAHMPIGYHGLSNAGLIMSNYAWPGIFRGGNNLRTFFAFLGCSSAILFISEVRKKVKLILYPIIFFIIILLFIIPKTEYFSKRILFTSIAAEAYVWDYKLDYFNPLDFYRSVRDNNAYDYTKIAFDPKTRVDSKLTLATSHIGEKNYVKAISLFEEILNQKNLDNNILSKVHYNLGNLYFQLSENKKENSGKLLTALAEYSKAIELSPEANYNRQAINQSALIYQLLGDYKNSINFCLKFLDKYPNDIILTPSLEKILAENYLYQNESDKALKIYENYIAEYSNQDKIIVGTKIKLAGIYKEIGNRKKEKNLNIEIISEGFENLNSLVEIYENTQKTTKNTNDFDYLDKSIEAFNLEINGKTDGIMQCGLIHEKNKYDKDAYLKALNIYKELENNKFSIDVFNLNNIFRQAETLITLSNNEENKKDKEKYLDSAKIIYEDIIKKYPNTNFSVVATKRLEDRYIEKKLENSINIIYDLGKNGLAFDNNSIIYPRQDMYLPGSLRTNISCFKPNCQITKKNVCLDECSLDNVQININAKGKKIREEDSWPKMQLFLNKHFITEWTVENQEFKEFIYSFKLSKGNYDFNIVYPGNKEDANSINNGLAINKITINQEEISLLNLPEITDTSVLQNMNKKIENIPTADNSKLSLAYKEITTYFDSKLKPKKDYISDQPNFKNLYLGNQIASRGITLYFASILALSIISFLQINIRTIVTPFIFFLISRGLIRIAEHDPVRAWYSILPGFNTGIQLILLFLLLSITLIILIKFYNLPKFLFKKYQKIKK